MSALAKTICLIFTLFSFGISQDKPKSSGSCGYGTVLAEKHRESIIINSSMPIFAEYCLQEHYDDIGKRKVPGKWDLRLVRILDTITRIYPHEYEEIRECTWKTNMFCDITVPRKYDSVKGVWTGGMGPAMPCSSIKNGYELSLAIKNEMNKVKEYHSFFKEKFYVGIPYVNYWSKMDLEELEGYKRFDTDIGEFLTFRWAIRNNCPPKESETEYLFSGKYNIRIIGECPKL